MRAPARIAILLASVLALAASCDSATPQRTLPKKELDGDSDSGQNKNNSNTSKDSGDIDPCRSQSGSSSNGQDNFNEDDNWSDGGGLDLLAGSVPPQVTSIMNSKCISCHNGSLFTPGNLKNENEVAALAVEILQRVKASKNQGRMPPAAALAANEIATIEAWVSGTSSNTSTDTDTGTGTNSDPSTSTNTGTGTSPAHDPCGSSDSSGYDPNSDASNSVVNPPEKLACHGQGLVYYRKLTEENPGGRCHEASFPPPFSCDKEGVLQAFNNNSKVVSALDSALAKGFFFDDCGMLNGKPAVFLSCIHSGDEVCIAPNEIDIKSTKNLEIIVSMMASQI